MPFSYCFPLISSKLPLMQQVGLALNTELRKVWSYSQNSITETHKYIKMSMLFGMNTKFHQRLSVFYCIGSLKMRFQNVLFTFVILKMCFWNSLMGNSPMETRGGTCHSVPTKGLQEHLSLDFVWSLRTGTRSCSFLNLHCWIFVGAQK